MAVRTISVTAAKRRLRGLLWRIERLHGELTELEQGLPAPTGEQLTRMQKREASLTTEAWLLGAVRQSLVHFAEAEDILSLALATTTLSLRRDWQKGVSLPLDLMRSLGDVVEGRPAAPRNELGTPRNE